MTSKLFVFQETNILLGLDPDEFDKHIALNQVTISRHNDNPDYWHFEGKNSDEKGLFLHPASLLGLGKLDFSQKSYLFIKKQGEGQELSPGLLMNNFQMQITTKKTGSKMILPGVAKNFPKQVPKSAFRFIQRFKRKSILVIDPPALLSLAEPFSS